MTWSHGQWIDATMTDNIDTKLEVDMEEDKEEQQPMFHVSEFLFASLYDVTSAAAAQPNITVCGLDTVQ